MRTIKKVHKAHYNPISDLETHSPLPTEALRQIDPFIFLNHHGPQMYSKNNNGLPFGPHPHRGMETVTVIIDGDITHKDSEGNVSVITAGGVQWMTAGKGLIHAEVSSDEFKANGGNLEILQLWLNLPAKYKMTEPFYKGLQKKDIPSDQLSDDSGEINIISGEWHGINGAFESKIGVFLSTLIINKSKQVNLTVSKSRNIFFYVVKGSIVVNQTAVAPMSLIEFENDADELTVTASDDAIILYGHSEPINETVVAQGPFVMNTQEEIKEAYDDYKNGKFGIWKF